VQRVVRHQLGKGPGDAVEERVEALLGEDVVEDFGEALVRLDESLRGPAGPDRDDVRARCRCSTSDGTSHGTLIDRRSSLLERSFGSNEL
jgi:hypothetical protein